ncbi:MAG: CDP-alcohol phosphatidyltransferase family protein [Spirochaetota bacterium]
MKKKRPAKRFSLNYANIITLSRVVLAPIIAGSFFLDAFGWPIFTARIVSLVLIVIAELTDMFDGMAARAMKSVSDTGKVFDPFADSFYRFSIFAAFTALGYLPLWMLLVFFYRDSLVSVVRTLSGLKGTAMAARISGKVKAVVQAAGTFIVILVDLVRYNPFGNIADQARTFIPYESIIFWTFALITVYTAYSAVDYLAGSYKVWGKGFLRR